MGRRHTAASRQLDLGRPQHELLTHAHTHLVGTIGNHAAAHFLRARRRRAEGARQFIGLAKVAMSAGDSNHRARRIDAWADYDAFVDRTLQTERRPAKVANGGESAHQRLFRLSPG